MLRESMDNLSIVMITFKGFTEYLKKLDSCSNNKSSAMKSELATSRLYKLPLVQKDISEVKESKLH